MTSIKKAATRSRASRPYREAFPTLTIEDVITHVEQGFDVLEFTNELDVIVGHVRIVAATDAGLAFEQLFFGAVNVGACNGDLHIQINHRRVANYSKPMLKCPSCGSEVQSISLVSSAWACRNCHGLVYLAQRLTLLQRLIDERDNLVRIAKIERGRDYAERRRDRRRVAAIEKQLGEARGELPQQLRYRVRGRWLGSDERPKSVITAEDIHYGWVPSQARGFHALRKADEENAE